MNGDLVSFSAVRIGIVAQRAGDAEEDQQRLAADAVRERAVDRLQQSREDQRAEDHEGGLRPR